AVTQHPKTGTATLKITLTAAGDRPPRYAAAGIAMIPPAGTTLVRCEPACDKKDWAVGLAFEGSKRVTADFNMRVHDFGIVFGRVTTSVVIPEINYQGKGKPTVLVGYDIPSASSYDWSSSPPSSIGKSRTVWAEDVTEGVTAGRIAVGVNPTARKNDDTKTFIAGALLGLGGGAILSAVQEALRKND